MPLPPSRALTLLAVMATGGCGDRPAADAAPPPALPAAVAEAAAPSAQAVGTVCPDPASPCPGFHDPDLSFVLPTDGVARAEVASEPFFAVLLRSGAACSIPEADRRSAQAAFPGRKVFSHRFGCDDDTENAITYTNVDARVAFLAVYAGRTRAEADSVLSRAGAYPGANLRRMQAKLIYP